MILVYICTVDQDQVFLIPITQVWERMQIIDSVMPFKAMNNCGQPWTRSQASQVEFLRNEVNSWVIQRVPVHTLSSEPLWPQKNTGGDDGNTEPSLYSLWQWVILLPTIILWKSSSILCFWVEHRKGNVLKDQYEKDSVLHVCFYLFLFK